MSGIKYMISMDSIKTCMQGALGAMTFGAYHMYVTNGIIEQNNKNIKLEEEINRMKIDQQIDQLLQENREIKAQMKKGWFY